MRSVGGVGVEETGGERSNLAFVKVNTWPFAQQEVIVLHMLACGRTRADFPAVRISSVCSRLSLARLFVRVFITPGFSLRPGTDPY